jgi:hypothetical protein
LLFVYAREDQNSVHCNEIYSAYKYECFEQAFGL